MLSTSSENSSTVVESWPEIGDEIGLYSEYFEIPDGSSVSVKVSEYVGVVGDSCWDCGGVSRRG